MSGVKRVSFEELKSMKFNAVERFWFIKGCFYITDTLPPLEYGADFRDYTVYEIKIT